MIDIKAIKVAAEAATPGDWAVADTGVGFEVNDANGNQIAQAQQQPGDQRTANERRRANAKHIATANPAAVIALCDEVERLQQQLAIYEQHGVTCQTFGHKLTGCAECNRDDDSDNAMALDTMKLQARQYFALLPEVERLRKDAARYQWLCEQNANRDASFNVCSSEPLRGWYEFVHVGNDLDAAIDAAMEANR